MNARPGLVPRRAVAIALVVAALPLLGAAPASKPAARQPAAAPHRASLSAVDKNAPTPSEFATQIRQIEELGGWPRAAEMLRQLRGRVSRDGDLELVLAWCEARTGQLDSAAACLAGPALASAGDDSLPPLRMSPYPWHHELAWLNGRYDGWHWYVWRTRAELGAASGHWDAALAAARRAVAARPLLGTEWHVRALCAAHNGLWDEADTCEARSLALDPTLPEAHYLAGWLDWRGGRRAEAQGEFRTASTLDPSYREPALAQMRLRLPGARPDSLPGQFLTGTRRPGLLLAPDLPKSEVFIQDDSPAAVLHHVFTADVDSTGHAASAGPIVRMQITVLVGADGRALLVDLPHYTEHDVPVDKVSRIIATLPEWRFKPAMRAGHPAASWAGLEFAIIP